MDDPRLLSRFHGWLSVDERARLDQFRFNQHKRAYLVSHALLRAALSLETGRDPASWVFENNAYGKPFLAKPKHEGSQLFNLSHTEQLAAVAIGQDAMLGIDAECNIRTDLTFELAQEFFSEEELAIVAALPPARQHQSLFDFWTLKESYIKAVGQGLTIPLDTFAFTLGNAQMPPRLTRKACQYDSIANWHFRQFRPTPMHTMALAVGMVASESPLTVECREAHWLFNLC